VKLQSIQALRALAAVLVAYSHSIDLQMTFAVSRQQGFYALQDFGAVGVDLFFVISGFIITFVASRDVGMRAARRFVLKRFLRVNPVYYLTSLLAVIVPTVSYLRSGLPLRHWLARLGTGCVDTLLVLPTSGRPLGYAPLLVIGWTLAFEWLFYALFCLVIVLGIRRKGLALGVTIALLVCAGALHRSGDARLRFVTNPIMLEFLLGVAICALQRVTVRVPRWLAATCLALGLAGYAYAVRFGFGEVSELIPTWTGRVSFERVARWGLPSALVVAGCVLLEAQGALRRLWSSALLQRIGDASYSLYLTHLTVFALFGTAYQTFGFTLPADGAVLLQLAVAVAVSLAFYRHVEEPLLRTLYARARL
jgi:peptidoglycan/LPS O-acetylase OafA/YrhL